MRKLLRDELVKIGAKGNWDHITNQIGMFSFTGMSKKQCEILIDKYHIYLLKNGRISMAGINESNYGYLAASMKLAIDQA
jgi:aspartate/tyrosine/aromatic aminotransferase